VKRLRCIVAGKVVDETFCGSELRLVSLIGINGWKVCMVILAHVVVGSLERAHGQTEVVHK